MKTIKLAWKKDKSPVKVSACGSTWIDLAGRTDFTDLVYICDEPEGHIGMHIDKVERKAWVQPDLRLRKI